MARLLIMVDCISLAYPSIEAKLPIMRTIYGYRNIEVYGYLNAIKEDRNARVAFAVYGDAHPSP